MPPDAPGAPDALQIDLTDPAIQRMLGRDEPRLASGKSPEVVQLAGDVPDPTGVSSHRGSQATRDLSAGKIEVVVVYKGLFLTVDVYVVPGEPLRVHLHCPGCRKLLMVSADRKDVDFEAHAPNPVQGEVLATGDPDLIATGASGRLSIGPFQCTWERGKDAHVPGEGRVGTSLCRLRIAIDDNRAKDA